MKAYKGEDEVYILHDSSSPRSPIPHGTHILTHWVEPQAQAVQIDQDTKSILLLVLVTQVR